MGAGVFGICSLFDPCRETNRLQYNSRQSINGLLLTWNTEDHNCYNWLFFLLVRIWCQDTAFLSIFVIDLLKNLYACCGFAFVLFVSLQWPFIVFWFMLFESYSRKKYCDLLSFQSISDKPDEAASFSQMQLFSLHPGTRTNGGTREEFIGYAIK